MTRPETSELSTQLASLFVGKVGREGFGRLFRQLLSLLAEGNPVSPDEIAAATGKRRGEVAQLLRELPSVEVDEKGNLVGLGLTLRPTPHKFEVGGRTLYTWCALDTLIFPLILAKPARIESPCPMTGTIVRLQVTPDRLVSLDPSGACMSLVTPESIEDVRGVFCSNVHFFSSSQAASQWLLDNPHAVILSVAEGYALAQQLAGQGLAENLKKDGEAQNVHHI